MNDRPPRLLFLDGQTTGARPTSGHLLELAWAAMPDQDLRAGALPTIHAHLCRLPEGAVLPPAIVRLTGITAQDMASQAHEVKEVATALQAALHHADMVVIHYAAFEAPFLEDLWQRQFGTAFPLPIVCTHKVAKALLPALPSRSIRALAGYFGWPLREAKRAGEHVEGTIHIMRALLEEITTRGHPDPWREIPALLAMASKVSRKKIYPFASDKRLALPAAPGVYIMKNCRHGVLYVGKATSLHARVNSYFRGQKGRDPRKQEMLTQVADIEVRQTASAIEAALLENDLIKSWMPPYNAALKGIHKEVYACDRYLRPVSTMDPYAYGPFAHGHIMEVMAFLQACATTTTRPSTPPSFFPHAMTTDDPMLAAIGDKLREILGPTRLANPRALLAWGWQSLRATVRAAEQMARENQEQADDAEEAPRDESLATEEMVDWDVDDWVAFLLGALRQAARQALRGRWLKRLANSRLYFKEPRHAGRHFIIRQGDLRHQGDTPSPEGEFIAPWEPLTPLSYDRLSVLLQECTILARKGGKVEIHDAAGGVWNGHHLRTHYTRYAS